MILMAMVTMDVLVVSARGSRWGGALTGIAAAVKLVPLIFIPHLFLTGKRAEATRALAVFTGLQGLALVIAPRDCAYWTSYVFQTGRIGRGWFPDNQSLDGLMARVTSAAPWSPWVAWAAGAVLAVPALTLMLRYHRRGQDVAALCVTACYGLLLAPVSWRPDWVWMAPVLVVLLSRAQLTLRGWAGICAMVAVFTSRYTASMGRWFFVLGNIYVLTAIAIALVVLLRADSPPSEPSVERIPDPVNAYEHAR